MRPSAEVVSRESVAGDGSGGLLIGAPSQKNPALIRLRPTAARQVEGRYRKPPRGEKQAGTAVRVDR